MYHKIKSRDEVASIVALEKENNKVIGFTSGSFDIIHAGHAYALNEAKNYCDLLVVGVNSDISVKSYKGDDRPLIPEKERAMMIAAIESVDYVFLFDERRNKTNIEIIKPNKYIKSGDYSKSSLTSAEFVEKLSGEVVIIPLYNGFSSSTLLQKLESSAQSDGIHTELPLRKKSGPVIFLDRDGTINENISYLHEPGKFQLISNALKGLKKFQDMDFRLAIVTNQPGIGMGYFTKEDFFKVNQAMFKELSEENIMIEKIYFCPHSFADKCSCRKPNTGLFERAKVEMKANMKNSFMVGDDKRDIEAGKKVGCTTISVGKESFGADYHASDLLDAADWVLEGQR